jgi:hypothetical protein
MDSGDGSHKQLDDTPVGHDEIQAMLRGMLRHQNVLKDATRVGMDAVQFNAAGEVSLCFMFAAMKNLMKAHDAVTKEMLITELRAWHAAEVFPVGDDELAELQGFIEEAFTTPPLEQKQARAERGYVEAIVRRFMNTRLIKQQIQKTLSGGDSGPVDGLDEKLSRWTKAAQAVKFIGRSITNSAAMPTWGSAIELPPPPIVTSMPWIDQYVGGFRTGDIIGVLGPYSGGKTTLMATAAVRMAQNYAAQGENKLSIFIGYEDGSSKMNHMFWSAAAHVDRNLFSQGKDFWLKFSTRDNPKDYDKKLPENRNGKIITGERERWDLAMPWFNKHFVFLDFSENAASGGHGAGGVAEIVAVLTQLAEARGMEIGLVAIDYAGLLLNRELAQDKRTKNLDQIWRQVQILPDNLRTMVAVPFDCTVMLAHQLAGGDIKKIPAYRYVTHLEAQGSKAFAENLHSCICINTRDPETRVSTINWSKIRAMVPTTPYGLIRMDDTVVNIHLVNDDYVASETSRRIIRKGEDGLVAPDASSTLKRKRSRGSGVDTFGSDL